MVNDHYDNKRENQQLGLDGLLISSTIPLTACTMTFVTYINKQMYGYLFCG